MNAIPCPFCGSLPFIGKVDTCDTHTRKLFFTVECHNENCTVNPGSCIKADRDDPDAMNESLKNWNRRHITLNDHQCIMSNEKEPMPLEEFQKEIAKLSYQSYKGCGDGGCQIKKPTGMHTNGGCRCNPRAFSDQLLWLAGEIEKHGRYAKWPKTQKPTKS